MCVLQALSVTSLSPNPALAEHFFFTVSALIFYTDNPIQFTASKTDIGFFYI
jgi:hypothetical protein